jgi:hypothetical protein
LSGTQFAADLQFGLNSHPQLCGLCGGELVYALFDEVFVNRIGVQRLIESETRFAQAAVGGLALVFVLRKDRADPLALFGREAELLDRICGSEWFNRVLRLCATRPRQKKSRCY